MKQLDLNHIITGLTPSTPEEEAHLVAAEKTKKEKKSRKPKRTCTETALDILARRNVSEKMMVEKLTQKKFPEDEIAATMARLIEMEYLDDAAYLKGRITYRREVSGWGWVRIERELKQQGLADEMIQEAFYTLQGDDEEGGEDARAQELLARWLQRKLLNGLPEDYQERQKLKDKALRFLIGRGFAYEHAKSAWAHCTDPENM